MCTEKSIEELMINAKCKSSADYEKQMKIVDFVNREHGESLVTPNEGIYIVISKEDHPIFGVGYISLSKRHSVDDRMWEYICTISEYNQCIEEMKYHYDIPKWCSYNRADKELLTVENSDQSFYEKETFVYGQDVYVNNAFSNNERLKFGFVSMDGERAILFNELHYAIVSLISEVSSKPFKSKEDIELEEAKRKQIKNMLPEVENIYGEMFIQEFLEHMQDKGLLPEIILPLEKS